ncbi:helix-turn-helix domain-containing protein [Tepidimonas sp.]|uniref:helix-turn-helix domain-containing protein n=1 Tax=Tepidimonas sp. TaxID=2002775 RepID=UPI00391C63FA
MTDSVTRRPTLLHSAPELGPVVRERRKSQSLRIDDAAGLLGVSVDLMSRLENGQGSVRLDKALAVLDGLGLTLMVLPKEHPWAREAASSNGSGGSDSPSAPTGAPKP